MSRQLNNMKKMMMVLAATLCCTTITTLAGIPNNVHARISDDKAPKVLTAEEVSEYEHTLLAEWKDSVKTALLPAYRNKMLRIDTNVMLLDWRIYIDNSVNNGDHALYISLHGGGGGPSFVNDSQWENQKRLYRPKNAVYLCPRAIEDVWNMHFLPETDEFYRRIIMMAEAFFDVDPDKVYILGYSAGGDGVWRMGPRMADTWAAASMMAGHPGDVSLVNLRNLPFMIWCGELDAAYDRNKRCQERIDELGKLHSADPEGYVFEGHIVKGKGHWMDSEDNAAIEWMAQYKRNPYPKKIVWRQEEVTERHFYWLSAPVNELERGKEVIATINGNTINIEKCDYTSLTLSLNDKMMNLDSPVTVVYKGKNVFKGKVERRSDVLRTTLYSRNDPAYMFPVQIRVNLPQIERK